MVGGERPRNSPLEILLVFLRLGLTSFGGPVAHLGYFRAEFVERRRWLANRTFAEVVALAQSLPGPASSQVGFAVGLLRCGPLGGLAAWFSFTAPSALLMLAFAFGRGTLTGSYAGRALHGLQLVAVAVVAQAVLAMQRSLAPDLPRLALAAAGAVIVSLAPASFGTLAAILLGLVAGLLFLRRHEAGPTAALPAIEALLAIFLPGLLLMTAALPLWTRLRYLALVRAGLRGVNASVVGVLAAALSRPVWTTAVRGCSALGDEVRALDPSLGARFGLTRCSRQLPWAQL